MKTIHMLLLPLALLSGVSCTSNTRTQPFVAGRPLAAPIQYEVPPFPLPKAIPVTEIRRANPMIEPAQAKMEPMLLVADGESSPARRRSTDPASGNSSMQRPSDLRRPAPAPKSQSKLLLTGDPSGDQALLEASRIFDGVINSSKN